MAQDQSEAEDRAYVAKARNGAVPDRYTLGVGGRLSASRHRHMTTSSILYPHLSSAVLTAPGQCQTLARY